MSKINSEIIKSLKEGLWLSIKYKKPNVPVTHYWIAINDIIPEKEMFNCNMINRAKEKSYIENAFVKYEYLVDAKSIENTYTKIDEDLLDKISNNPNQYSFLNFDSFKQSILEYYIAAHKEDSTPFQEDFELISGIDHDQLLRDTRFKLNNEQFDKVMNLVSEVDDKSKKVISLSSVLHINVLSIKVRNSLFSIAHKRLFFDIKNEELVLENKTRFNSEFLNLKKHTYSFKNYFTFKIEEFVNQFDNRKEEFKEMLKANLLSNEKIDDRPYLFIFKKEFNSNIEKEFNDITDLYSKNQLTTPLKAFFGQFSKRNLAKKSKEILLLDEKVNIDQLRVVNNALFNPITYVQGPPGTGKTSTIVNTLLSCIYNDQKVMVTSNNNHPINSIKEKLRGLELNQKFIHFPFLRLGNNKIMVENLNEVGLIFKDILKRKPKSRSIDFQRSSSARSELVELLNLYEKRQRLEEQADALKYMKSILVNPELNMKLTLDIDNIANELNNIPIVTNDLVLSKVQVDEATIHNYIYVKGYDKLSLLNKPRYKELRDLIILDQNEQHNHKTVRKFKKYISNSSGMKLLLDVFPVILTTNLSSMNLGESSPYFDLIIIDEAGQCNPATSLLPIVRGKRLLLVGDTNQLQPIVGFDDEVNTKLLNIYNVNKKYSYKDQSILSLMHNVDSISKSILLKYHYRCKQPIIGFSNDKFYQGQLNVQTSSGNDSTLKIRPVRSEPFKKNVSINEVVEVVKEIKETKTKSIGVITPFRAQAEAIRDQLKNEKIDYVTVGTVHTFQGDEKSKIIFSLGVTGDTYDKTFEWVRNNRELLNVATTRARNNLVLVCDPREVRRRSKDGETSDIYELISYVKKHGKSVVSDSSSDGFKRSIRRGKKDNVESEKEFEDTIAHFVSINKQYYVKDKRRLADVLEDLKISKNLWNKFLSMHFDFVLYEKVSNRPVLAVEIDGESHRNRKQQIVNDKIKKDFCDNAGFKIISIDNEDVRRYELIKDKVLGLLEG